MDYCNKAVVLPPPFNILGIVVDLLMLVLCRLLVLLQDMREQTDRTSD